MAAAADLKPNNASLVYLSKDSWGTVSSRRHRFTAVILICKHLLGNNLQQTRKRTVKPMANPQTAKWTREGGFS